MAVFHPDIVHLVDYAAGNGGEALALLIASHITLCPLCRSTVAGLESVGGVLIDGVSAGDSAADGLAAVVTRLDQVAQESPPGVPAVAVRPQRLPRPLRDRVGPDPLPWRRVLPGLRRIILPGLAGGSAELLLVDAGCGIPRHTHRGCEFNLVLAGGFSDRSDHYRPGDVATAGPSVDHRPVADPGEPCLCLAVSERPPRFTGPLGRLLNLFGSR